MITTKLSIEKATELFQLQTAPDFGKASLDALKNMGVQISIGEKLGIIGPNDETIVTGIKIQPGVVQLAKEGLLGNLALVTVHEQMVPALKWATDPEHWKKPTSADEIYTWTEQEKPTHDDFGLKGEKFEDAGSIFDDDKPVTAEQSQAQTAKDLEEDIDDPSIFNEPGVPSTEDELEEADSAPAEEINLIHPEDALKLDQVQLAQATKLYQPVNGTSETSTYHCVGLAGDFKFAARRKGKDLSIRVEGPIAKWKTQLITAGFNSEYAEAGKYTSVHFSNIDDVTAARALGAVLAGTGLKFQSPLPSLDLIEGAGK